jgi:hypothetical protein
MVIKRKELLEGTAEVDENKEERQDRHFTTESTEITGRNFGPERRDWWP